MGGGTFGGMTDARCKTCDRISPYDEEVSNNEWALKHKKLYPNHDVYGTNGLEVDLKKKEAK